MTKSLRDYSTLEKVIFGLGWLNVTNLLFWIVLIIVNNYNGQDKFWNNYTFRTVFYFGTLVSIGLISFAIINVFFD